VTVSIADIDRWDPGDVREVFHATRSRAEAAFEAADGIAALPAFGSWGGDASEAAKNANDQLRKDLDAHGNEALAVAKAAQAAADDMEQVKSDLAQLEADAADAGFEIDGVSNQVIPGPALQASMVNLIAAEAQREELQARLNGILVEAARVDEELARAINMATGAEPIPDSAHDNRPEIQDALSRPMPDDPKQFRDLWEKLTPEEKDWLYSHDHNIGNHPGMPFDPADHLGRDHFNRLHLNELMKQFQGNVDQLQQRYDALARQAYMGDHSGETANALAALGPQLQAARHQLDGYKAVNAAINPPKSTPGHPNPDGDIPRYLGLLDDQGHAAVSLQNPDLAKKDATFVPGTGQDTNAFEGSNEKSIRMYRAALAADKSLMPGDVSVTTWMGYDRPMNIPEAGFTQPATSGAGSLDAFQDGLRASHVGAPSLNTVIGHSYGSTVVGAAANGGHHLDANSVIAVGSPGMLVPHAGDLNLDPGAGVYATRAVNDVITFATDTTLGPDPIAQAFGATGLMADPGPSLDPYGIFPSVEAHSSYWNPGNVALRNMGAVIAGAPPPVIGYPSG
jgi:hypothetical protein